MSLKKAWRRGILQRGLLALSLICFGALLPQISAAEERPLLKDQLKDQLKDKDPAPAPIAHLRPPKLLVELFTSQGCSSCPPADRFAAELARRDDLLVLSFPVDYWNYLGWTDTLASPIFTSRQRAYAAAMGTWQVYTPQIIIDGEEHTVGSRRPHIERIIRKKKNNIAQRIPVNVTRDNQILNVEIGAHPQGEALQATAWLASFVKKRSVSIAKGENRGKRIVYTNVVRHLTPIGMWKGKRLTLNLPETPSQSFYDGYAVILQDDTHGRVMGAGHLFLK